MGPVCYGFRLDRITAGSRRCGRAGCDRTATSEGSWWQPSRFHFRPPARRTLLLCHDHTVEFAETYDIPAPGVLAA